MPGGYASVKKWRAKNLEKRREYAARYREKHPDKIRERQRRHYYRHRQEILDRRRSNPCRQLEYAVKKKELIAGRPKPELCEICELPGRVISFDHCHSSGKFRGWLCTQCNTVLGMSGDSPDTLRKLADYLERHRD